jgi:hypothetical protein
MKTVITKLALDLSNVGRFVHNNNSTAFVCWFDDNVFIKNITLESSIDNVKSDILCTAKVNTDTFDNLTPVEGTGQ